MVMLWLVPLGGGLGWGVWVASEEWVSAMGTGVSKNIAGIVRGEPNLLI